MNSSTQEKPREPGRRIDHLVIDFFFRIPRSESGMLAITWKTRLRFQSSAALLFCGLGAVCPVEAQSVDSTLNREVMAVRAEVARSKQALRQYTWTEHTEVRAKGDLKASTDFLCQYDDSGKVIRTPVGQGKEDEAASGVSKRYRVRKKADMQDYIERAVGMINTYVPLDPDQVGYLLRDGRASLGPPESGKSTIRLKDYFQRGDYLVFAYDPASKALLKATVVSTLGTPKDPVSLEAVFETLPNGVTHLATATVNATAKKVEVITRNTNYQKRTN